MSGKSTIFWRVYLSFFLVALMGIIIISKIVKIQTVDGDKWRGMADSLTTRFVEVEPNRGNIYSADGNLLATSLYMYDLHMDLKTDYLNDLQDEGTLDKYLDTLSTDLANFFRGPEAKSRWTWKNELITAHSQNRRYHPIQNNVNHLQLKEIRQFALFKLGQYKGGLIVEQKSVRRRPYSVLAERTIGYKRENVQPVGLEGGFDNYLSGVKGKRLLQKVSSRDWIPIHDRNEVEPQNGRDIYTTIDIYIQDFVESILYGQLAKSEAHHGCALVMEVKTGKILAIANLGTTGEEGKYRERYNYAIGESTQPGSTFKLAGLLALLNGGHMRMEDTMGTGNGSWEFYDQIMYDSKVGGYGTIDLLRSFEVSSNIFFGRALEEHFGHQPEEFINFLKRMRLHEPLGVPIVGEPSPLIKSPLDDDWFGTTLPWMAHGYELTLTPLQTLMIYNAVANGGDIMQPLLVTEVKDVHNTEEKFKPTLWARNTISKSTAERATKALVGVIQSDGGTAQNLRGYGISIAGKTGTAVLGKDEEGKKEYQASFAGFFPAEDPKYSCIVVINNPKGVYYGADVAGPVFAKIAQNLYSYDIDLHQAQYAERVSSVRNRPTFITAYSEDVSEVYGELALKLIDQHVQNEWVEPMLAGTTINLKSKETASGTLPNLRGLSLSDALFVCENLGLKVQYDGMGNVYRQVPLPGAPVKQTSKVYINLN